MLELEFCPERVRGWGNYSNIPGGTGLESVSKPRYRVRCAARCADSRGRPRDGDQWVHLEGQTLWVCASCAERLGRYAGLPTTNQRKARARAEERRQQRPLL